jgi:hypothetical protein
MFATHTQHAKFNTKLAVNAADVWKDMLATENTASKNVSFLFT